ncbi:MAG: AraC family transcriptional regulator [Acidobacteriota bacterium]
MSSVPTYISYRPRGRLGDFVDLLWYLEGYRPAHHKERVLPSARVAMVIDLREEQVRVWDKGEPGRYRTVRGPAVCGVQDDHFVIDTAQQETIMGVHFRPGGAFPFFRAPIGELANQHLGLEDLWGRQAASELRERLLAAGSGRARSRLFETSLLARLDHITHGCTEDGRAVRYALGALAGPVSVAEVARRMGWSARRLIALFRRRVGSTPKRFQRISRFQQTLSRLEEGSELDLSALALDCGYYDQAHFNRDFQAFSGLTPSAYVNAGRASRNHVVLE